SKIAVWSNEPAVDPVGACVGPKGSRVRNVVTELRGEKIDVVPWSENPSEFVANALQPAKVREVRVDPNTQTAQVIVPDYQLSLGPGGAVSADRHRRLRGRGAYVHPTSACVDRAIRRGSLARSLRSGIGPEEARKLRDVVEGVQGNG